MCFIICSMIIEICIAATLWIRILGLRETGFAEMAYADLFQLFCVFLSVAVVDVISYTFYT